MLNQEAHKGIQLMAGKIAEHIKAEDIATGMFVEKVKQFVESLEERDLSQEQGMLRWELMCDCEKYLNSNKDICPQCSSIKPDPCGRGGKRCTSCGHTFGAD